MCWVFLGLWRKPWSNGQLKILVILIIYCAMPLQEPRVFLRESLDASCRNTLKLDSVGIGNCRGNLSDTQKQRAKISPVSHEAACSSLHLLSTYLLCSLISMWDHVSQRLLSSVTQVCHVSFGSSWKYSAARPSEVNREGTLFGSQHHRVPVLLVVSTIYGMCVSDCIFKKDTVIGHTESLDRVVKSQTWVSNWTDWISRRGPLVSCFRIVLLLWPEGQDHLYKIQLFLGSPFW